MTSALDQSILELLSASRDDEETIQLPVNNRTFGLHAQQASEKLLKALIGAHGQRYAFTHDIEELAKAAQSLGEQLPIDLHLIVSLTDYAGIWRYQEPQPMAPSERAVLQELIITLRAFVVDRLEVLRPGVNWQ